MGFKPTAAAWSRVSGLPSATSLCLFSCRAQGFSPFHPFTFLWLSFWARPPLERLLLDAVLLQFNERGAQLPLLALMPKRNARRCRDAALPTAAFPFRRASPNACLDGRRDGFSCRHAVLQTALNSALRRRTGVFPFHHFLFFYFLISLPFKGRGGVPPPLRVPRLPCACGAIASVSRGPGHDRHRSEGCGTRWCRNTTSAAHRCRCWH